MPRALLTTVVAAAATAAAAAAAAAPAVAPCFVLLNSTFRFVEACYTVLHNGTGGLSLREYPAAAASGGVTLVAPTMRARPSPCTRRRSR